MSILSQDSTHDTTGPERRLPSSREGTGCSGSSYGSEMHEGGSCESKSSRSHCSEVGSGRDRDYEKLAIFGSVRGRRGAEFEVLSAVKTKVPG